MSAKIPMKSRSNRKSEATPKNKAKSNLDKQLSNKIVALNFRVPAEFKKNFKIAAATQGITQSELLQQAFDEWKHRNG
jgi:hypothetical protein